MKRSEKVQERGRKIQAHAKLLMEAKTREKEALKRRANFRVVGGTDSACIYTIEAARCLCGGLDDVAAVLLEMAQSELKGGTA